LSILRRGAATESLPANVFIDTCFIKPFLTKRFNIGALILPVSIFLGSLLIFISLKLCKKLVQCACQKSKNRIENNPIFGITVIVNLPSLHILENKKAGFDACFSQFATLISNFLLVYVCTICGSGWVNSQNQNRLQ
jgi:hypothetical protein